MYSYIYDAYLNNKKYDRIIAKMENSVTDLDIRGRICRLTLLNTIKATIEDEIRRGAKTIVIVGNDKTISKALDVIVPNDIVLGIIPMGSNNSISRLLGINSPEDACQILSSRIIKHLNLGKVNDSYFINNATIQSPCVSLDCDESYKILLDRNDHSIKILNSPREKEDSNSDSKYLVTEIDKKSTPRFFRIFKPNNNQKTILNISTISINNSDDNIPIVIDGQKIIKSPAIICKSPIKLKVIVGKQRQI